MKKIILVTFFALLGLTVSFAQQGNGKGKAKGHEHAKGQAQKLTPEQRVEAQLQRLNAKVGLTEAQKPQVKAIIKTKVDKMEALRAKGLEKEAHKTERKAIMTSFHTELSKVLTAEQKQKLEAAKKEKKAKHEAMKGAEKISTEEIDVLED